MSLSHDEAFFDALVSITETWVENDPEATKERFMLHAESAADMLFEPEEETDPDFDPYNPIRHGNPNLDDSDPPRWEL